MSEPRFLKFRAGDVVKHRPTGETWVLAFSRDSYRGEEVSPCGWPCALAMGSDCEMVEPAEDAKHVEMLQTWACKTNSDDIRHYEAKHLLSLWQAAFDANCPKAVPHEQV